MNFYKLSEEQLNLILTYLADCPYKQVWQLVKYIQEAEKIEADK